jgi:hypothetical protein
MNWFRATSFLRRTRGTLWPVTLWVASKKPATLPSPRGIAHGVFREHFVKVVEETLEHPWARLLQLGTVSVRPERGSCASSERSTFISEHKTPAAISEDTREMTKRTST